MKSILSFAVLMSVFLSSCFFVDERVKGNGQIQTEDRKVGSFNEVHVSGSIDVYITQGDLAPVRVETDANLLGLIEVETNGNVLSIRSKNNYSLDPTRDIKVYVSAPMLKGFDASGACHIHGESKITSSDPINIDLSGACGITLDLNSPSVDADLSGACSLELSGETKNFTIEGSGSANAKCFDLKAESVDVSISGAGEVETFASVKLDVEVSGAGSIRYKGSPTVNQSISGAGSVSKVE